MRLRQRIASTELTSNAQSTDSLFVRQGKLEPLGVVVVWYDLLQFQVDEALLASSEDLSDLLLLLAAIL